MLTMIYNRIGSFNSTLNFIRTLVSLKIKESISMRIETIQIIKISNGQNIE